MMNLNSNLGVFNYVQVIFCILLLSSVVLLNADIVPSNDVASSICPKTRNVSLCWSMLKLEGNTPLTLKLANNTLSIAHTSAVKCLGYVQRLEAAETTNPQLKKRYSTCSRKLNFAVQGIELGKYCLHLDDSFLLAQATTYIMNHVDGCLDTFKQPPPESSELHGKVKNLGDICNILFWVSTFLNH